MKIESIRIYSLSNALHLQFILAVLDLIGKFGDVLSKITVQTEALQACADKEDFCYKIIRKSSISAEKKECDQERDSIISALKNAVKSLLRHFDAGIQEAARRIKIVIDAYDRPGRITKLPYDAKTAAINNLLQEFDGKYAADVQTTGLPEWVEELRALNNAFDDLARAYNKQQAEKPLFRSAGARKNTDKAYQDIVAIINVFVMLEGEANYEPFIVELNTLIKHYNDLVAQHRGRLKNTKTKNE